VSRPDADALIQRLGLEPHPEGGHFRETWREAPADGSRGAGTAIYFLLRRGEASRWHRVDAAEIWHHYLGAPLELGVAEEGGSEEVCILGTDLEAGQLPQRIVPAGGWQRARSLGDFTLVGCTVSPAFQFEGFEMAPEGFSPVGGE
jgi:predicted cupin superfamily sugar epimerase